jgi:hypothetical protein
VAGAASLLDAAPAVEGISFSPSIQTGITYGQSALLPVAIWVPMTPSVSPAAPAVPKTMANVNLNQDVISMFLISFRHRCARHQHCECRDQKQ